VAREQDAAWVCDDRESADDALDTMCRTVAEADTPAEDEKGGAVH
jgi:hypothetical protein